MTVLTVSRGMYSYLPAETIEIHVGTCCSSWRLVHKDTTAFGPLLWLQVYVDKPPLVIYPPTITVPLVTPPLPEQSLTNENLLKSIGFVPGDSAPALSTGCDEEEDLLTTFDVVETPNSSFHSLASYNSLNQPPPQHFDDGKCTYCVCVCCEYHVSFHCS